MRPPLIDFTTFNRMGASVRALSSLLASDEDFELHVVDNASADGTKAWLRTVKDGRLKSVTELPRNLGSIAAANLTLARREPGQDYIRLENDTVLHTRRFVSAFRAVADAFGAGSLQATLAEHDLTWPEGWEDKNGLTFYRSLHMAHCVFVPGAVMDRLGFWDEAACFGDQDMFPRIARGLNLPTGYTDNVQTSRIDGRFGYGVLSVNCLSCKYIQGTCKESGSACFRFDPRSAGGLHAKAIQAGIVSPDIVERRISGSLPILCGTAWKQSLEPWELMARSRMCEFYARSYEEHLASLTPVGSSPAEGEESTHTSGSGPDVAVEHRPEESDANQGQKDG